MSLPALSRVSPLNVSRFALKLQHHPNQALVCVVLQGLSQAFHFCFNPGNSLHSLKKKNKASAYQHPKIIDAHLSKEIALGRVHSFSLQFVICLLIALDSYPPPPPPPPKKKKKTKVDDIIKMVCRFSKGALMTKFDIDSAYCHLAVHPCNRYLLGLKWRSRPSHLVCGPPHISSIP